MAESYAALVSLIHVLNRTKHPSCPISLDKLQIQSLSDKVSFLLDFLEQDSFKRRSKEIKGLQRLIADAAYAAEHIIESYVVCQILSTDEEYSLSCQDLLQEIDFSLSAENRDNDYVNFFQDLQKVIQKMDFIETGVRKIKERKCEKYLLEKCSIMSVGSLVPLSSKNTMVGFEDELIRLMEMLTTFHSARRIIPVVGMGGIGKTTLARNAYGHPFIVSHFHVRAWVTVSQDYSVNEIIDCVLRDIGVRVTNQMSDEGLGEKLHKGLFGRKYLIVLDDIWSSSVWDEIMRFLPDNSNGSRILLTTRLSNVGVSVGSCSPYEMKLLDDDKSLDLLYETVFGQKVCPSELEKNGEKIVKSCKGLPLAIVVIGGLLKMSPKTREYWNNVVENVNSIINVEFDEHCFKILSLSYGHLPIHLKPCFLYMASFPEDFKIPVSRLIKLWVADGFLKPTEYKTLEEVALEYLNDLIDRNLIMVGERGSSGKMKNCYVHDLLRDLCLGETQKERFLFVIEKNILNLPQRLKSERRIVIHPSVPKFYPVLPSTSLARSLVCNLWVLPQLTSGCRLLRVLHAYGNIPLGNSVWLVNLRYLALSVDSPNQSRFLSSISLMWNLETLIIDGITWWDKFTLPSEIWNLAHLRQIVISKKVILPDPVTAQKNDRVLNNLQTLSTIDIYSCTDEVLNRIPNLEKLGIYYDMNNDPDNVKLLRCFNNLVHRHKLETLKCFFIPNWNDAIDGVCNSVFINEVESLTLSPYLRKLTLSRSVIPWENMKIVGLLPNLEVLKLQSNAFRGQEWNSTEGEFQRLKYLMIRYCKLVTWRADSSCFPRLERLDLFGLELEEIPEGMGEVMSLELIRLSRCQMSVVISAKKILEEQQDLGNNGLVIQVADLVVSDEEEEELQSFASDHFQVQVLGGFA